MRGLRDRCGRRWRRGGSIAVRKCVFVCVSVVRRMGVWKGRD